MLHTARQPRGGARSRVSCRAKAAATWRASSTARRRARSTSSICCGADEFAVDQLGPRLRRLSGQPWRRRRAQCRCRPAGRRLYGKRRPLRQFRRPRAGGRTRRPSRRARRRKTGRSCARCPMCSASGCLTTIARRCVRRSRRDAPHFADHGEAPRAWRRRSRRTGTRSARTAPLDTTVPLGTAIADYYLTNPIARASAHDGECSRAFVHGAPRWRRSRRWRWFTFISSCQSIWRTRSARRPRPGPMASVGRSAR